MSPKDWQILLGFPDQRVRLEAEWALADHANGAPLLKEAALATSGAAGSQLSNLHGIWGLGIIARRAEYKTPGAGVKMLEPLVPLLGHQDMDVRCQAAQLLGAGRVVGSTCAEHVRHPLILPRDGAVPSPQPCPDHGLRPRFRGHAATVVPLGPVRR